MNPYVKKPTLRTSFCLFLDVLGFSKEIIKHDSCGDGNTHLTEINKAIGKAGYNLKGYGESWNVKIFTDNVVLGSPIDQLHEGDEEGRFGHIVMNLVYYQLSMVLDGFFVRGGWSIGNLFMNTRLIYGKALIEAHEIESKLSIFPRVILSEEMKMLVKKHLNYYSKTTISPQKHHVLKDEEDNFFINYLVGVLDDDYEVKWNLLAKHKNIIEGKINTFRNDKRVLRKYKWAAFYHNYFCNNFIDRCPRKYLISKIRSSQWKIESIR